MTDWIIEKHKFNDYFYYTILEPNPDAGKQGVCYAGQYLAVCDIENEQDAELIVSLHNDGIKALKKAKSYIETITHYQNISPMDIIDKVLNKLEEE